MNPMDLRKGILNAVEEVVKGLKEMSIPIKGKDQI
jgi:chaperonin GroEL (HSP60 family)